MLALRFEALKFSLEQQLDAAKEKTLFACRRGEGVGRCVDWRLSVQRKDQRNEDVLRAGAGDGGGAGAARSFDEPRDVLRVALHLVKHFAPHTPLPSTRAPRCETDPHEGSVTFRRRACITRAPILMPATFAPLAFPAALA